MQTVEVETMPQVIFAHVYHADAYSRTLNIRADSMEIAILTEGGTTIEYDGKVYVANKGDLMCVPRCPHEIKVRADAYHEHRTVMAQFKWRVQDNANGLYLPIITAAELGTKKAENIIEQLIRNQLLFKDSPTRGASAFLELLCEIDYCNRRDKKLNLPSEVLYTRRAKEYVQSNLQLPITEKSVAEHLGISPEYLCSIFKKNEGVSFIKYVNTEKLAAIRTLVEKEDFRLYEAAVLFGYRDPNYVSRLFKKYYGYSITRKPSWKK